VDKVIQKNCPHFVGPFDLYLTKYTMYLVYVRFGASSSKHTVVRCVWLTVNELDARHERQYFYVIIIGIFVELCVFL